MADDTKIVGLDGKPVATVTGTSAAIVKMLEAALEEALAGHIAGVALVTINADREAHTQHRCDTGFNTELLGSVDILKFRMMYYQLTGGTKF